MAFVCGHLLQGSGLGFHCSLADEENPYPDAWCTQCETFRLQHGEWDEVPEDLCAEMVGISLICGECYEEIRGRNLEIRELIEKDDAGESGGMSEEKFRGYCHDAVHELMELNAECDRRFHIGQWERWDYDGEAGTITFSEAGVPKVVAEIQTVGGRRRRSRIPGSGAGPTGACRTM